jgi:predicted N-formylglutamate amidohydrolase
MTDRIYSPPSPFTAEATSQDPPAFDIVNPEGRAPLVLIADHAGRAIPARLGTLGLDEDALGRHIAWDIGIAELTRTLAHALDAVAVLSTYSRLVIDCNRLLDDATSIPAVSDGVAVPANRALDAEERARRVAQAFDPYHAAVTEAVVRRRAAGAIPALVSMHSFTPVFEGFERPWHIGILWNRDPRIPVPLMRALARDPNIVVGDNEPYSARRGRGYSLLNHGAAHGLPHVLIEVRQDLIDTRHGVALWAGRLGAALEEVLADEAIYRVEHHE